MMADLAGVVAVDEGVGAQEWVDIGPALPLRTRLVDLLVTETPDGGLVLDVRGRDGAVLSGPTYVLDSEAEASGFAIRVGLA